MLQGELTALLIEIQDTTTVTGYYAQGESNALALALQRSELEHRLHQVHESLRRDLVDQAANADTIDERLYSLTQLRDLYDKRIMFFHSVDIEPPLETLTSRATWQDEIQATQRELEEVQPVAADTGEGTGIKDAPDACTGCLDERDQDDMLQAECGHWFCEPCIRRPAVMAIENEAAWPVQCCGKPFDLDMVSAVLHEDEVSLIQSPI